MEIYSKIKRATNIGHNRVIREVTLSSPCLWASFHPLAPLSVISAKVPIFYYISVRNAETQAFNAQGSRVIIVVVHVRAVKIYTAGCSNGGAQEKGKTG